MELRGEIKADLHYAGFMFWNDEFREFAHQYVLGKSHIDSLAYFIKGSTITSQLGLHKV